MKRVSRIFLTFLIFGHCVSAAPKVLPNPDFTKGETVPKEATKDWNLGATGARGWIHSNKLATVEARQVYITKVAPGSPSAGLLEVGDVLLGVGGKAFSYDPRTEMGKALTLAEAKDGKFLVTRWRAGQTEQVTIPLTVLGKYSATAPYDCPKSAAILAKSADALAKRITEPGYKESPTSRALNGLGLLATGDPKYHPVLKTEAQWAAGEASKGMGTWYLSYVMIFLSEYIMATGDASVLPGLRDMALHASKGQSAVGSWGHGYALPDGRLGGYGMMNSPGLAMTIGLVLAREAGVDDPEVAKAIDRSSKFLRFFAGKGSIPYGDHDLFMPSHEDNGKNGMAAVLFDQLGEKKEAEFFAKMSTAAHGSERDCGHTGNFFNVTWAVPGVSRCGPQATGAWMQEFGSWYFDLARSWDGRFTHLGPPQITNDSYANWDTTGAYLIAYAMPKKAIFLTGKKPSVVSKLDEKQAKQVIADGNGFSTYDSYSANTAYSQLSNEALMERLASWSPIVRERAAIALAKKTDLPVEPIIAMLDSPSLEARLGACSTLIQIKGKSEPALPKLLELLKAKDLWLRIKAAEALAAIDKPARVAVPELLKIVAAGPTAEDPRGMEQRYVARALFNGRSGLLRSSLEGVDHQLLFAAMRAGLQNEDGATRGVFSTIYQNLTYEQLQPMMPTIIAAVKTKSPSGEMFDGQIQSASLDLLSKHYVSEGIELLADYVRLVKPHGSQDSVPRLLDMLKRYGAHAQRAIPQLEKAAYYFENEEKDFPKNLSLKKAEAVRKTIQEIQAMTEKPELKVIGL